MKNTIIHGNVMDVLKHIPDESIQMCVTSPPYWGLRDYKTPEIVWGGGQRCKHEKWTEELLWDTREYGAGIGKWQHASSQKGRPHIKKSQGKFCLECTAWKGHLGLEPTPELYADHVSMVFREVGRILKKD